jgi:hypothetical protein
MTLHSLACGLDGDRRDRNAVAQQRGLAAIASRQKIAGYEFVAGRVDVSSALKAGTNTVRIQVSSSLRDVA